MIRIFENDNLQHLMGMESKTIDLIYIDPPFNTGVCQKGRISQYSDDYENYLDFLRPRLEQAHRVLKENGSLLFHIDWRESHYCKVLLDVIFGRESFLNELIWAYDYGAKQKNKWPTKHDTIFWYAKDPKSYTFNYEEMWRLEYMAPSLVGSKEKVEKGKVTTDVIWNTICPTNGPERTGYPTQKPVALLEKLVQVHSNRYDLCLDFFAGSGTFGEACKRHGRRCILVDDNPDAIEVMRKRLLER